MHGMKKLFVLSCVALATLASALAAALAAAKKRLQIVS